MKEPRPKGAFLTIIDKSVNMQKKSIISSKLDFKVLIKVDVTSVFPFEME